MTGDEILALLQQGRGQEIDFKAERTSARKLAESLVALANASGGAVLVGVDPRTSASGSAELTRAVQPLSLSNPGYCLQYIHQLFSPTIFLLVKRQPDAALAHSGSIA